MRDLSKIKLGIALPNTMDTYPSNFVDSFCAITKPRHLYLKPTGGGPIDAVRNDLVLKAFTVDCTHIWMTDTDQVYPQDTLMRLLEHDLDIAKKSSSAGRGTGAPADAAIRPYFASRNA